MNNDIEESKNRVFHTLLTNPQECCSKHSRDTITQLIEQVAFLTATRFSRRKVDSVCLTKIDYQRPGKKETMIELSAEIISVTDSTLCVRVEIYEVGMFSASRTKSGSADFTFVVLKNDDDSKMAINLAVPDAENEFIGGESELRRMLNSRLSPKTIARATLYNHLQALKLRKALYTKKDFDLVVGHLANLRSTKTK